MSLALVLVCALALTAATAFAAPSSQDQYTEQIPGGGGSQSPSNLVKQIADTPTPTAKDVADKAKQNAAKDDAAGDPSAPAQTLAQEPPPAVASASKAGKIGPVSKSTAIIIGGILLIGGVALASLAGGGATGTGGAAISSVAPVDSKRVSVKDVRAG